MKSIKVKPGFEKSFKYAPKIWASLLFFFLIVLNYILFAGRKEGLLRFDFFERMIPGFYSHISNFSLSFMLMLIIGFLWILMAVKFRHIISLALVIIALNFFYELFLPILNTKDIVDAYFGTVGTLLGLFVVGLCFCQGKSPLPKN